MGTTQHLGDSILLDEVEGSTERRRTATREAAMRRVRWLGVVFTLVQFLLYKPPAGARVPWPKLPVALAFAAAIIAVNLHSLWRSRRHPDDDVSTSMFGLVADTAIVLGVVWAFSFDGGSALWALLIIPVIEAAYSRQLWGALQIWAVCAATYAAREVWAAGAFPNRPLEVESISYRMGIVLIVALTCGYLARDLVTEIQGHRNARKESERRANLIEQVASSGRLLAVADHDQVLATVVDSALRIGFEGAEICVFDEAQGTWTAVHPSNLPPKYGDHPEPLDSGIAGVVRARRERVVIENYSEWEGSVEAIRGEGFRTVVGSPVWFGDDVVAALIVGNREAHDIDRHALEALDLLSGQAGAALANARSLEHMEHQATHDALTGLPNQVLFDQRCTEALAVARATGTSVAVAVLDVDRFKRVNDSLGHDAGNEVLRQIAHRLAYVVSEGDTVARMGGDEFTLMLTGVSDADELERAARRIESIFSHPFEVNDQRLILTGSLGLTAYPEDGLTSSHLVRNADLAMYRAKNRGRNGFELYRGELGATSEDRLAFEEDLHLAVMGGGLRIEYQPQIDLIDQRIIGVEALVRWEHPTRGVVFPDEFIPVAEECGLIAAIDTWVLQEACRQARRWLDAGHPPTRMAVNVSGPQFRNPLLGEIVTRALAGAGLAASALELEVTEHVAADELADNVQLLDELRAAGVSVAIDDFGTGYSGLERLQRLRVDRLKIDKSFVRGIAADRGSPIVMATIAMAHSLGLTVVAEGVETEAQLRFLEQHGCDFAQGYLFGRAVHADEIDQLLAAARRAQVHPAIA